MTGIYCVVQLTVGQNCDVAEPCYHKNVQGKQNLYYHRFFFINYTEEHTRDGHMSNMVQKRSCGVRHHQTISISK